MVLTPRGADPNLVNNPCPSRADGKDMIRLAPFLLGSSRLSFPFLAVFPCVV